MMDNIKCDAAIVNDPIKCHPLKKSKSLIRRKSSRSTIRSTSINKRSANQRRVIRSLVKEFLAYRLSAAGVSYIVKSRTKTRRCVWAAAVILSFAFMGYMTMNVILEYLGYPKSLIREGEIATKLYFPAVTVCSLNSLLHQNIEKTTVAKFLKLKEILLNATNVPTDSDFQSKCYEDPLCQWSWFSETCNCVASPCITEFCLPANSTHCVCSFIFCEGARFRTCASPSKSKSRSPPCYCSVDSVYQTWVNTSQHQEFNIDPHDTFEDREIQDIIKLIRNSNTYDLADIEDAMLPSANDLYDYGVNFDSMVISCSFEGDRCYRENFTVLYHPKYGKCYMFNFVGTSALPSDEPISIYNYGSSSGLQMIMHVPEHQMIDLLNDEVGVRVVVHDPMDLPFVDEYGINVRPIDMTAVEVTLARTYRLGPPWGECVEEEKHVAYQTTALYSILGCEKVCRHRIMMGRCNCTRRQYLRGSVFLEVRGSYTFCSISNEEQHRCMNEVILDMEHSKVSCICKPPCKDKIYSSTVSSSRLNENFYRAVKAIRTLSSDGEGRHNITNTTGKTSMVGLKIYYNTFQVDNDKETASYSWETLVANIGGNLGFFMGLTLVTFVELFEFLWDLLLTSFRKPNYFEQRSGNKIYTITKSS